MTKSIKYEELVAPSEAWIMLDHLNNAYLIGKSIKLDEEIMQLFGLLAFALQKEIGNQLA